MTSNPKAYGSTNARRTSIAAAIAVSTAALATVSYLVLTSWFLQTAIERTPQRAQFFANAIDDALTRLEHLPYVLSIERATLDALTSEDPTELNPILDEVAQRARAEFVYVLDINGRTLASSNYAASDSLVGNYYTFRPYFLDALAGGEGRFYAVGVTTGRPGYFIAEPVRGPGGAIFGVVAVKIGFEELSRSLSDSGAVVMVTDPQGVVLTSSNPDLIYGLISPLSAFNRRSLEEQQQFGDKDLFQLDWTPLNATRATLDGTEFIWTQAPLVNENWTLHLLSGISDIRRQAILYVVIGVMACLGLIVAAAVYRAAQLRQALAKSNADRLRLANEIEERQRAEDRLEAARAALARKNQLASLGQLSASITHELGQPISAMRNYLVAEEIDSGGRPGSSWPELTGLVNRMQRILDQLRLFGRRNETETQRFCAQDSILSATAMVQHSADEVDVSLTLNLPDDPLYLRGEPARFEQVIVNLLRNAIDAAADTNAGAVQLELIAQNEHLTVSVADNGAGLGDLNIATLREPFFSTKPSGKGMGLGLAISGQIIDEMGGTLRAEGSNTGGACFSVELSKDEHEDV